MNQSKNKPVMLWVSSHSTLAAEEIPLFLEAGFRVIPTYIDFWTFSYSSALDQTICGDWKASTDLPQELISKLQSISFCNDMGVNEFDPEELELINNHVDVIYLTILPNLAIRLAEVFQGTVLFRPFGHGEINNYSTISKNLGVETSRARGLNNLFWVPILSTLQEPENLDICSNTTLLSPFVSESRLLGFQWESQNSDPYVVETIPRITEQTYYEGFYRKFISRFGSLPMRILGKNQIHGGAIDDSRIVGSLKDREYFQAISKARIAIYHGESRFHLHYHPIEYMKIGVPVLFSSDCSLACEARLLGVSEPELLELGMCADAQQTIALAELALNDINFALQLSQKQRFFSEKVFSRERALEQVRWLKLRISQNETQRARNLGTAAQAPQSQQESHSITQPTEPAPRPTEESAIPTGTAAHGVSPYGVSPSNTANKISQQVATPASPTQPPPTPPLTLSLSRKILRECKRICRQVSHGK